MLDGQTTAAIEILLSQFVEMEDASILFKLKEDAGDREMRLTKRNGHFFVNMIETY